MIILLIRKIVKTLSNHAIYLTAYNYQLGYLRQSRYRLLNQSKTHLNLKKLLAYVLYAVISSNKQNINLIRYAHIYTCIHTMPICVMCYKLDRLAMNKNKQKLDFYKGKILCSLLLTDFRECATAFCGFESTLIFFMLFANLSVASVWK